MILDASQDALKLLQHYLDALTTSTVHLAPQAYQIALGVERFQGVGYLITGAGLTVVGIVVFVISYFIWLSNIGDNDDGKIFWGMITTVGGAVAFIVGLGYLINVWNWAAALQPQVALAHEILKKVMGQ